MITRFSLRKEQGQAMTEFVLVLPLLALLLFAVIQFGILFNHYLTVTDAARAGARRGAVSRQDPDPAGAAEQAARDSAENLDQGDFDVGVGVSPAWEPGAEVSVSASYPYEVSLLGFVVASGDLTSTTKERVE
jgi:Flp pilus assembly protein TadG